jgi:hypothetical protein
MSTTELSSSCTSWRPLTDEGTLLAMLLLLPITL